MGLTYFAIDLSASSLIWHQLKAHFVPFQHISCMCMLNFHMVTLSASSLLEIMSFA